MTRYLEVRTHSQSTTLGADIARHLEARQDLGTTIVICSAPTSLLSVVRKQWMQLSRQLQRQRASTLNPEEILRLTHTIMHMQRMQFVAKAPNEIPDADVYFVDPDDLTDLPHHCFSIYLASDVPATLPELLQAAPTNSLVVDYGTSDLSHLGLKPKVELERKVLRDWEGIAAFLRLHHIEPGMFTVQNPTRFGALDEALDTLLSYSHEFLKLATDFRQAIHLAQPLSTVSADQQQQFTAVMRLAYRVQTLSPDSFNTYLLKTFGEKESYFLRDYTAQDPAWAFFGLPCLIADED